MHELCHFTVVLGDNELQVIKEIRRDNNNNVDKKMHIRRIYKKRA